jgi:hypothetical protein
MDQLKPLLRKLQRNIDRAAIVVFFILTGAVIYFYQSEQSAPPAEEPREIRATHLDVQVEFPDENYQTVMTALSWGGDLYASRPIDRSHPFFAIIEQNLFREPLTMQELHEQALELLEDAQTAFNQASQPGQSPEEVRVQLERTVNLCNRVIDIWAAQSGGAEQAEARALLERAQALLDSMGAAP